MYLSECFFNSVIFKFVRIGKLFVRLYSKILGKYKELFLFLADVYATILKGSIEFVTEKEAVNL